jgi:pimeloyl-ACP methyl ester carboxylesterase
MMPRIKANGIAINYDQQGAGEPIVLIPYLAADHACYAFQVADYAKHFTCISLDLRGTGETDKPEGAYTTEILADDVAAFMQAMGIGKAHIAGLSLGAAIGIWVAAKYPDTVESLSLHGGWSKTDAFQRTIVEGWQVMANALGVPDMIIRAIFPWCFTPELYATRPDYIESLAGFVRSRPAQSVADFIQQSNAVIAHDAEAQLGRIAAPTLITFGSRDLVTSTRFAARLKSGIPNSEVLIFEGCAHAPLYEQVEEFNAKTLQFLQRRSLFRTASAAPAAS